MVETGGETNNLNASVAGGNDGPFCGNPGLNREQQVGDPDVRAGSVSSVSLVLIEEYFSGS